MQKRKHGNSGLEVSALGLGCMGMSEYYGEAANEAESIATIHRALDLGFIFFVTAESFGPYANEELLGRALKGRRDNAIVATKFGIDVRGARPAEPIVGPNTFVRSPTHRFDGSASITSICSTSIGSTGPCRWRMSPGPSTI